MHIALHALVPSVDADGTRTVYELCCLPMLGFNQWLPPAEVLTAALALGPSPTVQTCRAFVDNDALADWLHECCARALTCKCHAAHKGVS